MKKIKWLFCILVIVLLASCKPGSETKEDVKDTTKTSNDQEPRIAVDSTKTVISLAQLVLDTLIEGQTLLEETKAGNLKKLWKYDERLYLASNQSKKFIVTKEINPCCPCSATEPTCCACLIDTDFAAVDEMRASATLDGTDMKTTSTVSGVQFFRIPPGMEGTRTLKISGQGLPSVSYSVTIANGRISFN